MQFPTEFVRPTEVGIIGFTFLSLAFGVICLSILRSTQAPASKLVGLGILVSVLAVGYAAVVGTPSVVYVTPGLMKIGLILVLGGVACSIASIVPTSSGHDREPS